MKLSSVIADNIFKAWAKNPTDSDHTWRVIQCGNANVVNAMLMEDGLKLDAKMIHSVIEKYPSLLETLFKRKNDEFIHSHFSKVIRSTSTPNMVLKSALSNPKCPKPLWRDALYSANPAKVAGCVSNETLSTSEVINNILLERKRTSPKSNRTDEVLENVIRYANELTDENWETILSFNLTRKAASAIVDRCVESSYWFPEDVFLRVIERNLGFAKYAAWRIQDRPGYFRTNGTELMKILCAGVPESIATIMSFFTVGLRDSNNEWHEGVLVEMWRHKRDEMTEVALSGEIPPPNSLPGIVLISGLNISMDGTKSCK